MVTRLEHASDVDRTKMVDKLYHALSAARDGAVYRFDTASWCRAEETVEYKIVIEYTPPTRENNA